MKNIIILISVFIIISCGKKEVETFGYDMITQASHRGASSIIQQSEMPDSHSNSIKTNALGTLFVNKKFLSASITKIHDTQTLIMRFNDLGLLLVPDNMVIQYRL